MIFFKQGGKLKNRRVSMTDKSTFSQKKASFGSQILYPRYDLFFDNRVIDILGIFRNFINDENLNVILGFVNLLGGLINIPTTNIIVSDYYGRINEFMTFLFDQVPSSRVFEIWGDYKNEFKKSDFFDKKILIIHNFIRNKKLIERLTRASSKGIKYKGVKIPKLTVFASTKIEEITPFFKKNCLIIEPCSLDSILNLNKELPISYPLKIKRLKEIRNDPNQIEIFLKSINHNTLVDIPYQAIIKDYFEKNKVDFRVIQNQFLPIIRTIAILNQNKRDHSIVKNEREGIKKTIFALPIDFIYAFNIWKKCFELSLDLLQFFI